MKTNLKHIQYLRAIAILLVILFHLKVPGFAYGYLGVDIFFVISGFIMLHLYPVIDNGKKALTFWKRRVRRILPAFLTTTTLFLVLFWIVSLPFERNSILHQYLVSNLFISNLYFWSQDQYFSSATLRPYLHTWSLSVELQFYLLFPLIAFHARKKQFNLSLITFFSLAIFILLQQYSPNTSFFWTPFRFWEFCVGMFVAIHYKQKRQIESKYSIFILLLALFLLVITLTFFDFGPNNPINNFLCVQLTALLLHLGNYTLKDHSIIDNILMKIGARSYVYYLVHFPLILLLNYRPFRGNQEIFESFLFSFFYCVLLILISELLHKYVERPNWSRFKLRNFLKINISLVLFISLTFSQTPTLNLDTSQRRVNISNSQEDRVAFRCGLLARMSLVQFLLPSTQYCKIYDGISSSKFLLIGNSHADSIKVTLSRAVQDVGGDLYLAQENTNVSKENVKALIKIIKRLEPTTVIFHSSHGSYNFSALDLLIRSTQNIVDRFVLVLPIPVYEYHVPEYLLFNNFRHSGQNIQYFSEKYESEFQLLEQLSDRYGILFVSTLESFCSPKCLLADSEFRPYYFDNNHLTLTGANLLYSSLLRALR